MSSVGDSYSNTTFSSQGIDSHANVEPDQKTIQIVVTEVFQAPESLTDRKVEAEDVTAEVGKTVNLSIDQNLPEWVKKAQKKINEFKQECEKGVPRENKKRILILVSCIVGIIFSAALIASGVGAIVGLGGLATILGGLGLALGCTGILASGVGSIVSYRRSLEKESKLIQNKEQMKLEKEEYEKIEKAIQNDRGYREFVESIHCKFKEFSSAEKIAMHLSTLDKIYAPILEAHHAIQSAPSDHEKMMIRFKAEMSYLDSLLKDADNRHKEEIQRQKDHMISDLYRKITELTIQKEFNQRDDLLKLSRSYKE